MSFPSAAEMKELRSKLDQEKKEVRDIRALESQLRWNIQREEKRQTVEEAREEARQIMEWREEQAIGMREYEEEKSREQRIQELMESKDFQEFKREWRQAMKEKAMQDNREQLDEDMQFAEGQADLKRAVAAEDQVVCLDHAGEMQDLREIKVNERKREQVQVEQDRAHEQHLEITHKVNQISSEKEKLLRSLQLMQTRQKVPVRGNSRTGLPRQRPSATRV